MWKKRRKKYTPMILERYFFKCGKTKNRETSTSIDKSNRVEVSPFKHPKVRKRTFGAFFISTASSIPKFRTSKRHVLLVLSALLHLIGWLLFTTPAICCKACFPRMISAQRLFLCLWHCDRGVQRVFHKQGDCAKKNLRNGIGRPDS